MAPMTRSQCPGGVPHKGVAEYYSKRAQGGVGLIITEGVSINHPSSQGYPDVPNIHTPEALLGWKNVIKAVHKHGTLIIPQLWHVGSVKSPTYPDRLLKPTLAPSSIAHPSLSAEKAILPKEMSELDISNIIEAYASAALAAKNCGFDGIEIHGAHGYLIDQFFWTRTNKRKDKYGGSLKNRVRFATEVVAACRTAVGNGFKIVFRFSQWKLGGYDEKLVHTPEELEAFLTPLCNAGVDVFHVSTRRYYDPGFSGSPLTLAGWVKKISKKPVIIVGSIGLSTDFSELNSNKKSTSMGIETLEKLYLEGQFDLAAVGRALISDPQWVEKTESKRINEIKTFQTQDLKTYL